MPRQNIHEIPKNRTDTIRFREHRRANSFREHLLVLQRLASWSRAGVWRQLLQLDVPRQMASDSANPDTRTTTYSTSD